MSKNKMNPKAPAASPKDASGKPLTAKGKKNITQYQRVRMGIAQPSDVSTNNVGDYPTCTGQ